MLSECGAFVLSFSSNTGKDNMVSMRFRIQVSEISFVDIVLKKLRSVRGVFDAHRMIAGSQSSKRKNKK